MEDLELVKKRIEVLEQAIQENRHTGRTYRIVSATIDELMRMPKGTKVKFNDHTNTREGIDEAVKMFKKRMSEDFPDVKFRIIYTNTLDCFIERETYNYQEQARINLEKWKEKLKEMEQ